MYCLSGLMPTMQKLSLWDLVAGAGDQHGWHDPQGLRRVLFTYRRYVDGCVTVNVAVGWPVPLGGQDGTSLRFSKKCPIEQRENIK